MTFAPWKTYTETLARSLNGTFDTAGEIERKRAIRELIRTCSNTAALVTLQPIPGIDIALITPIQYRMVEGVGRIHGYHLEKSDKHDMFKAFRGRLFALNAVIAGAKLFPIIPFVGDLFAISVAYALTDTIGELGDVYFRRGRGMTPVELRERFNSIYTERYERAYHARRNDLVAMVRPSNVKQEMKAIKEAHRAGRLDEDDALREADKVLGRRVPGARA